MPCSRNASTLRTWLALTINPRQWLLPSQDEVFTVSEDTEDEPRFF